MTKISKVPGYREAKEFAKEWNEELDSARKEHNLQISEIVAMSPGNDPFWMTPGKVLKAMWAQRVMEDIVKPHLRRIGTNDIHLRDIHYMLTGMSVEKWSGNEIYQNTTAHWGDLITAFANARYIGLVDPVLIRDEKNEFTARSNYRGDYTFSRRVEHGKNELTNEVILDLFISWFRGLKNWENYKPVHIEIWVEKDLALVEQVASRYKIDTVVGEGETSITQVYRIIDRMKRAGKPVRIGYVADCDVVGSNMSKAMARKMEFVISQLKNNNIDVKLTHLMLTPTQVSQYGLPTIPMKQSRSNAYETRKDEWMEKRGLEGAVEVNAFHALYPDEFRTILENFILSYFDIEIKDMIQRFNRDRVEIIRDLVSNDETINMELEDALDSLKEAIDEIDWKEQEHDYDADFYVMLEDEHVELDYSASDDYYQWLLDTELGYGEQLWRYVEYESGNLDNPKEVE